VRAYALWMASAVVVEVHSDDKQPANRVHEKVMDRDDPRKRKKAIALTERV